MQRIIHLAASCGLVILFAALLPFVANAHERREVADGQYELTVGFLDEPAFVGLKNGLDLRVERTTDEGATPTAEGAEGASQGVEGLTDTLQAEVIYGDQTMELELEPAFSEPGSYESVFFPMATGAYTFHIFGEIEGTVIDETFTSGPESFSEVEPIEPLQFPKEEASLISTAGAPAALGGLGMILGGGAFWLRRRLTTTF